MRKLLIDVANANEMAFAARKISTRLNPKQIYGEWEQYIHSIVNQK